MLNAKASVQIPPIPVLFIPPIDDEGAKKRAVNGLDAFLEPFIRELEVLFVDGIEVEYNYPVELIQERRELTERKYSLRAILAIFTGDHPAQCKFGGWNQGGYSGCRNCKTSAKTNKPGPGTNAKVVYDSNRQQMRYPPPARNLDEVKMAATEWMRAATVIEKESITREHGISNKTRAWRLNDLNGFSLSADLVYDTMHILALNVFKKYVHVLVHSFQKQDWPKFEDALAEVTRRRPKGFDGRWPKKPFERLGYFKAEEYSRFVMFCVPHILREMKIGIDSKLGQIGVLLVDIARLFYIKSRDKGWSPENMAKGRSMLASWRVRSEEAWGPNSAILEHVAGNTLRYCVRLVLVPETQGSCKDMVHLSIWFM